MKTHTILSILLASSEDGSLDTKMDIRDNDEPTPQEMMCRLAAHVLVDACDEVVLMMCDTHGIYLTPEIGWESDPCDEDAVSRPLGTVEWAVGDGLPGERSHFESYYDLSSAIARFKAIKAGGGWKKFYDDEAARRHDRDVRDGDNFDTLADELLEIAKLGIPEDFPVRVLEDGENPPGKVTCGTCDRSWDDSIVTSWTPAPSGRCPFEQFHNDSK